MDLGAAEWTTGLLTELTDVIERSFEENLPISSIPVGIYEAFVRTNATKKWMWTGGELNKGVVLENRAWRIELSNVPQRTNIQFHYGKDVKWSEGCLVVGSSPRNTCKDQCTHDDSPESAIVKLRNFVTSNGTTLKPKIRVRIANGVWP
jgi:hypothetical protein